jgi:hypothetical protein
MLVFFLQFNGRCELVVPVKNPAKSIWSTWMAGSRRSSVMDDELVVPVQRYATRKEQFIPLEHKRRNTSFHYNKKVPKLWWWCATAYWRHHPGHHLSFSGTLKRARTSRPTRQIDLPRATLRLFRRRRRLAGTRGSLGKMAPSS